MEGKFFKTIYANKGDETLLSWRIQKIFSTEKTLTQVKTTFAENKQLLLDETVSKLLDETVAIHEENDDRRTPLNEAAFIVRYIARALSMQKKMSKV